jgi:NAD(P)-dependent dehydrogenase (short-subunit alcohol dehydrogenase family)
MTMTMARAGANVVINFLSGAAEAVETANAAETLGVEALPYPADVSQYDQVQAMVAAAEETFGAIDILINNASIFEKEAFPSDDLSVWHRSIDTLVHGPFFCANLVAPGMLRRGEGVIVNIGDLSAFEAWPSYAGHVVGKSALIALTRQLALELAPAVRVNAMIPGPALRPHDYDDAKYERVAANTLLNRWGTPEEMAAAVKFLVEADYITGEVLVVDGGQRYGHRKHEAG